MQRVKPLETIQIYVQPDYEDVTFAVMTTETRLLFLYSGKAWNFWWEDEERLAEDLEDWYAIAERRLAEPPNPHLDLVTSHQLQTLIEETERHVTDYEPQDAGRGQELRIAVQWLRSWLLERGVPLLLPPKEEPDGRT